MKQICAYLAGAIDSDGSIGIKRSTYHQRVRGDARNAVFIERVMLKQVTPQIPELLHQTFGGHLKLQKPACGKNGRPLYAWQFTIPCLLVEYVKSIQTEGRKLSRPPQLIAWRERICHEIRELNRIGVNGTAIHR